MIGRGLRAILEGGMAAAFAALGAAPYDQIHPERRTGYSWYGTWPADLLETEYPRWQCRVMGRAVEGASCD